MSTFKNGIFVSYSHKDQEWLDKLMTHLKPLVRNEKIRVWNDTQIQPGSNWKDEIDKAIMQSRIAILLVSPNFLASDFIMDEELPQILKNTKNGKTIIYWIAISPSLYNVTELREIQSANNPSKPLNSLNSAEQDAELVKIAQKISDSIELNVVSNVMNVIDEFVPRQKAFLDNVPYEEREQDYSVQAKQQGGEIHFVERSQRTIEVITVADFEKLDRPSKQLIRSFETTMKDLFDRWTELQPKSEARDEFVKEDAREEMKKIRVSLCRQLNSILDFLSSMGKHLDDHYHHVRWICSQND
jgi:hypothetical protein